MSVGDYLTRCLASDFRESDRRQFANQIANEVTGFRHHEAELNVLININLSYVPML